MKRKYDITQKKQENSEINRKIVGNGWKKEEREGNEKEQDGVEEVGGGERELKRGNRWTRNTRQSR